MATLMECTTCGGKVSSSATVCPHCGEDGVVTLTFWQRLKRASIWAVVVMVGLGFLISKIGSSMDASQAESNKYQAIIDENNRKMAALDRKTAQEKQKREASPEYKKESAKKQIFDTKKVLTALISDLTTFNKFNQYKTLTIEQLGTRVQSMRVFGKIVFFQEEAAKKDAELKKLWEQAKKLQIQTQVKHYPKMRDALGPLMRQTMWEHDINIKTIGKDYSNMVLEGAHFAANRNIKTIHDTLGVTLSDYRFKRVDYKWFKGASEWTYFDIDSKKDNVL